MSYAANPEREPQAYQPASGAEHDVPQRSEMIAYATQILHDTLGPSNRFDGLGAAGSHHGFDAPPDMELPLALTLVAAHASIDIHVNNIRVYATGHEDDQGTDVAAATPQTTYGLLSLALRTDAEYVWPVALPAAEHDQPDLPAYGVPDSAQAAGGSAHVIYNTTDDTVHIIEPGCLAAVSLSSTESGSDAADIRQQFARAAVQIIQDTMLSYLDPHALDRPTLAMQLPAPKPPSPPEDPQKPTNILHLPAD